jgi:uncharacterized protein (TIGR03067 family)
MRLLPHFVIVAAVVLLMAADPNDRPNSSNSAAAQDEQGLQGNWRANSLTLVGEKGEKEVYPNAEVNLPLSVTISKGTLTFWVGTQKFAEMAYRLDEKQTPPALDARFQDRDLQGIFQREGKALKILFNETAAGRPKDFQPQGNSFAMELERDPGGPMFLLDVTGGKPRQLTSLLEYSRCGSPQWSPDGNWIAFDAARVILGEAWSQSHVFLVDPEGKTIKDLGRGAMPSWSPDGKRIALSKYEPYGAWVMNADGSNSRQVAPDGWGVRWSPKKEEVAYVVSAAGPYANESANLCIQDLESRKTRTLFDEGKYSRVSWGFTWSPDGKWICFMGTLPDGKSEIAVVHAEGPDKGFRVLWPREDLEGVERAGNYFTWSPDGKEIVLSLIMEGKNNYQLFALDAEGKKPPRRLKGQDPSWNYFGAAWSPDGKKIAAAASPGEPAQGQ